MSTTESPIWSVLVCAASNLLFEAAFDRNWKQAIGRSISQAAALYAYYWHLMGKL